MHDTFSPIEEIIDDVKNGRMVIMVDDENRENEGDLLMAAELVRPEDINYMATHGRGLICLTLSRERCAQLRLPLMSPSSASLAIPAKLMVIPDTKVVPSSGWLMSTAGGVLAPGLLTMMVVPSLSPSESWLSPAA